ncbi:MAG: penicillin-binding protein [Candidatus Moranbacteria bacterium CG06_land_8_20_14_3_00_40_12]|nr:MAG: penicillin-binding protein [Candidatus Moranbacteria bacterium CG23_combo_of_CG06-09_8_20_14_all_40_16]PIU80913.1 MAG: penicillin-binding protein [Candidatus Moranbacteria bacterium CG06_land_8_20_14_3_00_40_12]
MNFKKGPFGVFSRAKNTTDKKNLVNKPAMAAGKPSGADRGKRIFLRKLPKIISRVFFYFSGLMFLLLGAAAVYLFWITPKAELVHRQVAQTSIIYDRTGEHKLYEIHGEENRKVVTHEEIPDLMRLATIIAEDNSFYEHHGISLSAIIRSAAVNLRNSGLSQGASTITQQLARNAFLTREKSWERKIKEIVLALKIEARYGKDEILDFYLNEIPYGSNAYGIQAAAFIFFGKNAADLSLDEAALLASLPKATNTYSPYGNNKDLLITRQKMILENLKDKVANEDKKLVAEALAVDTLAKIIPLREKIEAPHLVFFVKDQLEKTYPREILEEGGLKIYTTLDYDMQKTAEATVKDYILANEKRYRAENGALVAINPQSGEILAMVGSRDYFDEKIDGEVNVAIQIRQPGSSFKPVVYAKAFEKGYQPETIMIDVETNFGPDGTGKDYIPNNYNLNFNGPLPMRNTLAMSLNIPAVKTLYLAGIDETIDLAERLGITSLTRRSAYGLSLALGGGDMTLLEETAAFSVFANDGKRNPATAIARIIDHTGQEIVNLAKKDEQVVDAQVARKINSILSDNSARAPVFGSQNAFFFKNRTIAGKTGTTQNFRDAWTVGYTPRIAVGVWVGNNDNQPMQAGADGSVVAGSLWHKFMEAIISRYPEEKFIEYEKVKSSKPMITGNFETKTIYFDEKKGKRVSEKKKGKDNVVEKKAPVNKHGILFYVNKDNPLGNYAPNPDDPMAIRWEEAIDKAYEKEDKKD